MAEFTLLKIQLDDSSFTANAPFSRGEEATEESDAETDEAESGGGAGAGKLLAVLGGLLVLALVAVLVKRKLGTEADVEAELVELDDIDA